MSMANIHLSDSIVLDLQNKVIVYAKIISGQSKLFKSVPSNLNDIRQQYEKIATDYVMNAYKLPKVTAKRYAKDLVKGTIDHTIDVISKSPNPM